MRARRESEREREREERARRNEKREEGEAASNLGLKSSMVGAPACGEMQCVNKLK